MPNKFQTVPFTITTPTQFIAGAKQSSVLVWPFAKKLSVLVWPNALLAIPNFFLIWPNIEVQND